MGAAASLIGGWWLQTTDHRSPIVLTDSPVTVSDYVAPQRQTFLERLNGPWHERGLQIFMAIVPAHWAEHLAQAPAGVCAALDDA